MRKSTFLAYAILIIGALASFVCYNRFSVLLPMKNADAVTHAQAIVDTASAATVKKGESPSDHVGPVTYHFKAGGKEITGFYRTSRGEAVPANGAKEPIVYLNANPYIHLRAADYETLPRQLTALRWMMMVFALIALILPFVVLGRAKRNP